MRVGTSYREFPASAYLEDHPHACGDKVKILKISTGALGSSPCVWGQDTSIPFQNFVQRIIPMRVGTSSDILPFLVRDKDHPHACGDKEKWQLKPSRDMGSSPCVWGQVVVLSCPRSIIRIIPMRVGTRITGIACNC